MVLQDGKMPPLQLASDNKDYLDFFFFFFNLSRLFYLYFNLNARIITARINVTVFAIMTGKLLIINP